MVLYGLQGPVQVAGKDYNSAMPAFGKVAGGGFNWSDDKIAAAQFYLEPVDQDSGDVNQAVSEAVHGAAGGDRS